MLVQLYLAIIFKLTSCALAQPVCVTTDSTCASYTIGCAEREIGSCFPVSSSISAVLVLDQNSTYNVELYGGQTCRVRAFSVATQVDECSFIASIDGASAYMSVKSVSNVVPGLKDAIAPTSTGAQDPAALLVSDSSTSSQLRRPSGALVFVMAFGVLTAYRF